MLNRRALVGTIGALPLLGMLTKLVGQEKPPDGSGTTGTLGEFEERYIAVQALRFINTAQLRYRQDASRYAEIGELKDSEAVAGLRDSQRAEKAGVGASLIAALNFDDRDFVGTWQLTLRCAEDWASYVAVVSSPDLALAFSTDNKGVIYEGRPVEGDFPVSMDARQAISSPGVIRSRRAPPVNKLRAFLRAMAVGPLSEDAGCTFCGIPCKCGVCCSCQSGGGTGTCFNCGCWSCIWCCCIY